MIPNAQALLWIIGNMAAQLAALQEENAALRAELETPVKNVKKPR